MSTRLRILAPDSEVYSEKSKAKMSTESIVSARTLRRSLARENTEKETSIDQSPDFRAGIKIKAPLGVQKKMQKERRGNSQSNDHKNYKNIKIQKKNKSTPCGGKKTTWIAETSTAKTRKRRKRRKRKKDLVERSAWEASVNASSLDISNTTDNSSEVTVNQSLFVQGNGQTSSQKTDFVRPEAATPNQGRIEKTAPTKRKKTEASSGPMVQVEEKRVRNASEEASTDSLELSSNDSLALSTCEHTTIQETPEAVQESQEDQSKSPSQSQQRRDNLITLLDTSNNSENLLIGNCDDAQVVIEELRMNVTANASDIFKEENKNENKNKEQKKKAKEETEESDNDESESEEEKEKEQVNEKPHDFQTLGPAVQGTSAGLQTNPPSHGTLNTASTSTESLESLTNFPGVMMNITPSMISMAQMAGIQNLSMMQQFQSPALHTTATAEHDHHAASQLNQLHPKLPVGCSDPSSSSSLANVTNATPIDAGRDATATVARPSRSDFNQKDKIKKSKTFNNNPNLSFFQVKIKPKSARGLFGASTVNDLHSVARPSAKFSQGKCSQKGNRFLELAYSSESNELGSDSLCHGKTLYQPLEASQGYSESQRGYKKQK